MVRRKTLDEELDYGQDFIPKEPVIFKNGVRKITTSIKPRKPQFVQLLRLFEFVKADGQSLRVLGFSFKRYIDDDENLENGALVDALIGLGFSPEEAIELDRAYVYYTDEEGEEKIGRDEGIEVQDLPRGITEPTSAPKSKVKVTKK